MSQGGESAGWAGFEFHGSGSSRMFIDCLGFGGWGSIPDHPDAAEVTADNAEVATAAAAAADDDDDALANTNADTSNNDNDDNADGFDDTEASSIAAAAADVID